MSARFQGPRWVRVDLTIPLAETTIATIELQAKVSAPANEASTNRNAAGTVAWCKTDGVVPNTPPVTRIDTDNTAALAEITAGGWYPE